MWRPPAAAGRLLKTLFLGEETSLKIKTKYSFCYTGKALSIFHFYTDLIYQFNTIIF
jgi:hypothetical protein